MSKLLLNVDINLIDINTIDMDLFLKVFLIITIPVLILAIIISVSSYKMFTKAGVEGWKAFIPIYNTYTMIEIAYGVGKTWLMTGFLATIASVFVSGMLSYVLSVIGTAFSLYITYGFLIRYTNKKMAIAGLFFPIPIYPIVAFGEKHKYKPLYDEEYKDSIVKEEYE